MKYTFSKLEFLVEDNTILGRLYRLVYGKPRTSKQLIGILINENNHLMLNKDADVNILWNAIKIDPETSQVSYYLRTEIANKLNNANLEIDYFAFKKEFKKAKSCEDWMNYILKCKMEV